MSLWNKLSNPPNHDRPVLIFDSANDFRPMRLAMYWRPASGSSGDSHWRWYEEDVRLTPDQSMHWANLPHAPNEVAPESLPPKTVEELAQRLRNILRDRDRSEPNPCWLDTLWGDIYYTPPGGTAPDQFKYAGEFYGWACFVRLIQPIKGL